LSGEGGLTIGEEVLIGPHVRIFSAGHAVHGGETSIYRNDLTYAAVRIEDGAWIGGGASILPGITVGQGAVVGAGSIVTKDVAPFSIVAGNPARLLHYRKGHELPLTLWQRLRPW
jgi:galactoside O-acetyltransferase